MKLLSIHARHFRTLQDIELRFSKGYCTISGKNNAGKSSVIRLLSLLFRKGGESPWWYETLDLDYKEDRTQWVKEAPTIEIGYRLELSKADDPALISFIEKIASATAAEHTLSMDVRYTLAESEEKTVGVTFAGVPVDQKAAKEIDKKIKDSDLLFLYNSTIPHQALYFPAGRRRLFYEFVISKDDKRALEEAGKNTERRLRKLAKQHKEALNTILGRLSEHLDVELSPPEKFAMAQMPIGINLRDKFVEVPLSDWGSGTQNRTQILMAVLQANRIRTIALPDDKITPVVVIEEPESFLHPSAQSEFGRILRGLAEELGVQIIVTTHSPYMLNREEPASNILLLREAKRGCACETSIADTSGEQWMAPFAEHLGIPAAEFGTWRPVFSAYKSKVLLVEGALDKEYFVMLQERTFEIERLSGDIELVPYGGYDALKNTSLVQFVLSKFDQVFITFDLDAEKEVKPALTRLGLKEKRDFLALGVNKPGKDCIEGLLPESVLAAVLGRETDLVMQMGSASQQRQDAKKKLKGRLLEEFKRRTDYSADDLANLAKVIAVINRRFGP